MPAQLLVAIDLNGEIYKTTEAIPLRVATWQVCGGKAASNKDSHWINGTTIRYRSAREDSKFYTKKRLGIAVAQSLRLTWVGSGYRLAEDDAIAELKPFIKARPSTRQRLLNNSLIGREGVALIERALKSLSKM